VDVGMGRTNIWGVGWGGIGYVATVESVRCDLHIGTIFPQIRHKLTYTHL